MELYQAYDVPMTTLPKYMQYREPRAPNSFRHVEARYMNAPSPNRRMHTDAYERPRAASPTNPRYANVSSRYRSPAKELPKPTVERLKRTESVKSTAEYANHKRHAAASGFGGTQSRYLEHTLKQPTGPTPKDRVEAQLKAAGEKKDGIAFKAWSTQAKSFADMQRENEQMKRWESPAPRSRGKSSVVVDWIERGVPIATEKAPSPPRRPSPEPRMGSRPYTGAGGAGGGSFQRRTNSPVKSVRKMEESKVRTVADSQRTARRASPPRVATATTPSVAAKYGSARGRFAPGAQPASSAASATSAARPLFDGSSTASRPRSPANPSSRARSPDVRGRSPDVRARSPDQRPRSPTARPRSPDPTARHRTIHHDPQLPPSDVEAAPRAAAPQLRFRGNVF